MVDEQNAHTDDTELPSPLEFRKDSEEENRDSEKDEDTKELEALPCKWTTPPTTASASALFNSSSNNLNYPFNLSSVACLISKSSTCSWWLSLKSPYI